jgi:hypothetical protein
MAKNKNKKGPKGKPQRDTAPNMFERLSNKKRFDVLGRKPKGDVRSVNKLRSAATEKVRFHCRHPTFPNYQRTGLLHRRPRSMSIFSRLSSNDFISSIAAQNYVACRIQTTQEEQRFH